MKKLYNLCIICGRFQPIHKGHEAIIRKALQMSKKVGLYIGSANNTGTESNPLSFEARLKLISTIFKKDIRRGRLLIKPLNDRPKEEYGNNQSWGKYYLDNIHRDFGNPDLFIYGNDKVRDEWFTKEDLKGIDEFRINRDTINISGSELRSSLISNDVYRFKKYTNKKIWKYFDVLRYLVLSATSDKLKFNTTSTENILKKDNYNENNSNSLEDEIDSLFIKGVFIGETVDTNTHLNKYLPVGATKIGHYTYITDEILKLSLIADSKYLLISSSLTPIFKLSNSFNIGIKANNFNGPYLYGSLFGKGGNVNVYVAPELQEDSVLFPNKDITQFYQIKIK